ncbi:MAG: hypothetical protein ACRDF4_04920 [Rhabdochlamydiaceae bacterium]
MLKTDVPSGKGGSSKQVVGLQTHQKRVKINLAKKQQQQEQDEIVLFRCKPDGSRFFSEEEAVAHYLGKHVESYKVKRVVEVEAPAKVVQPSKAPEPQKKVVRKRRRQPKQDKPVEDLKPKQAADEFTVMTEPGPEARF